MMTGKQTRTLWMMSQKRSSDGALAQCRALDALLVLSSKWEFFETYFTYVYLFWLKCDMWQHASFLCILWKGEWSYIVVCIICKMLLYCTLIFNSSMWPGQSSILFEVCHLILNVILGVVQCYSSWNFSVLCKFFLTFWFSSLALYGLWWLVWLSYGSVCFINFAVLSLYVFICYS